MGVALITTPCKMVGRMLNGGEGGRGEGGRGEGGRGAKVIYHESILGWLENVINVRSSVEKEQVLDAARVLSTEMVWAAVIAVP